MVRRRKSEYELRNQLRLKGWIVFLMPGSGVDKTIAVDLVALKRTTLIAGISVIRDNDPEDSVYFIAEAYEVKETNKKTFSLSDEKLKELSMYSLETGIPTFLAVKFKRGKGRRPKWVMRRIGYGGAFTPSITKVTVKVDD